MPNPRAQQQLAQVSPNALDRAVHELKSIATPVRAMGDMFAGALRGSVAATAGAGGDIRELIDLFGPEAVEKVLGKRVMPTTEEMSAMMPKATEYDNPYESLGQFAPLPGAGKAAKALSYGLGRGAGALTRTAGNAVNDAMVYNAGPLAAITPQPMRMFIGPQAKTFNHQAAVKAEKMLQAGVPPEQVWRETGTMMGKDGVPRQEISDAGATFRSPTDLRQLEEQYKAMIEAGKEKLKPNKTGQKDLFPKELTAAKKPFREELASLKEDMREIGKNPRTQGVAARWTLEHPELYRAYPELGDISVTQKPTIGSEKGSLTTMGGVIQDMEIKDIKDPRSVALHELQHAIQTRESMGTGGNPTFAFQHPEATQILNEKRRAARSVMPFEDYVRQGGYHADDPEELARAKSDYEDYVNDVPDIAKKYDRELQRDAAMEWYKRQHGEAEARATQERKDLTPTQRLEKFPYESYDVKPEDLLVRKGPPFLGVAKNIEGESRMPDELIAAREAMRAKAAEEQALLDAYNRATRGMPLNERPSMEEFRATNMQPSQADLDQMRLELDDQQFAGGGLTKLAKLARAPAKTKAEIEAVAQRMAPQMTGEYVRASEKSAKTVAGKTKKQFEREKELTHDIRPTDVERPLPKEVSIEDLKDKVMMGISGDPTITGHTIHGVAGRELRHPSPQHGGPLYGLGHDKEHFWASNLGAAQGVQNRAREIAEQYDAPVIGNYVMMGPDSYSYAQHFADANLQNIRPELMTKSQIEGFNKLVRQGSLKSGPRPSWAGIENPEEAYLQMAVDPELRKHFGNLMQMPTVTERFNMPSGLDVRHAVTEPDLRDLEIGVTGKSLGLMRPEVTDLKLSEHPTYSHDIPGEFLGGLKYPVPHELMFPDTLKAVRENPAQAPQEFGSFKMVGPRQVIDQQLIDEIKQYEEFIKKYTGKADGGEIVVKPKKMANGGEITAEDLEIEERPL